jgi:hypothetical protein
MTVADSMRGTFAMLKHSLVGSTVLNQVVTDFDWDLEEGADI